LRKIEVEDLKLADIILTQAPTMKSKFIRNSIDSNFSHSILYIGGSMVIESIGDGGVVERTLDTAISGTNAAFVFRYRGLTIEQMDMISRYGKHFLGRPYDLDGAIGSAADTNFARKVGFFLPETLNAANRDDLQNRMWAEASFYCSELVALAYQTAGVPLTRGNSNEYGNSLASTHPGEIEKSHKLSCIGYLKLEKK